MIQRRRPKVSDVRRSYIISVSMQPGCYRHIRISANMTLEDLHEIIISETKFWDVHHMHAFFMDNNVWGSRDSFYGYDENGGNHPGDRFDRDVRLSQLALFKGKQFVYVFDFGEEWTFKCRVLQVLDEDTEKPVVIQSKGKPPEQYPDDVEDEDEADEEEVDEDEDEI